MDTFKGFTHQKEEITKQAIMDHWKALSPTGPIPMSPKPSKVYGSGLDFDTIRISGSQAFIDAVLARLKDITAFDNETFELKVSLDDAPRKNPTGGTGYVFYCSLKQKAEPNIPDLKV